MAMVTANRDPPRWLGLRPWHIRCSMYLYLLYSPIQVDAGLAIWKGIDHDAPPTLISIRRLVVSASIDGLLVHVGGRLLELA